MIGPTGLLRHKTRVLVTHGIHFLPDVDEILVMKNGRISERGSYQELLERKAAFSEFLVEHLSDNTKEKGEELEEVREQLETVYGEKVLRKKLRKGRSTNDTSSSASCLTVLAVNREKSQGDARDWGAARWVVVVVVAHRRSVVGDEGGLPEVVGQTLIQTEEMETGGVKGTVYK